MINRRKVTTIARSAPEALILCLLITLTYGVSWAKKADELFVAAAKEYHAGNYIGASTYLKELFSVQPDHYEGRWLLRNLSEIVQERGRREELEALKEVYSVIRRGMKRPPPPEKKLPPPEKKPIPPEERPTPKEVVVPEPEPTPREKPPPVPPLTLHEAIRLALERNPSLISVEKEIELSEARTLRQRCERYPFLFIEGSYAPASEEIEGPGPWVDIRRDYNLFLVLQWTLYDGGVRPRLLDKAKLKTLSLKQEKIRKKQEVIKDVVSLYLQVKKNEGLLEIATENLKRFEDHLKGVEARHEKGITPKIEVIRAQEELMVAKEEIEAIQARLKISRIHLMHILGSDSLGKLLDEKIAVSPKLFPSTSSEAVEIAKRDHILLKETRRMIEEAEIDLEIAKRGGYPNVSFTGGVGLTGDTFPPTNRAYNIMLLARYPLWSGGRASAESLAAQRRLSLQRLRYSHKEQQIAELAKERFILYKRYSTLLSAKEDIIKTLEEELEQVKARYRLQKESQEAVIYTINRLFQKKMDLVRTKVKYEISKIELLATLGVDLENLLVKRDNHKGPVEKR
jgi:outer membrane protein TolC